MKKKLIYVLSYIILFFNSNVSSNENNNYLKVGLLAIYAKWRIQGSGDISFVFTSACT